MLEGWTTLGFDGRHSRRQARLGLMVGGVHYRQPALWVEGRDDARRPLGRSSLAGHRRGVEPGGIGRARLPVPAAGRPLRDARGDAPVRARACGRANGAQGAFHGRHVHAEPPAELAPGDRRRPHPPIMIGGGGEQKTLRLVAQYADATNVFGGPVQIAPQVRGPARALRGDRAAVRRDRALDAPERQHASRTAGGHQSAAGDHRSVRANWSDVGRPARHLQRPRASPIRPPRPDRPVVVPGCAPCETLWIPGEYSVVLDCRATDCDTPRAISTSERASRSTAP